MSGWRLEHTYAALPDLFHSPAQPTAVRDEVYMRDRGQCTYVSADGTRCTATRYLEVDHVRPFALGGSSTDADNNRLLCKNHNQFRARQTFGELRFEEHLHRWR